MGANNSKIDTDFRTFPSHYESNFIQALEPPTSTTSLYHESTQTVATSSDHRPIRSASTSQFSMSSKIQITTRPLPPVESRHTVKSQASQITSWRIIDDSDEIYESFEIGNSVLPASTPCASPKPRMDLGSPALEVKTSLAEIHGADAKHWSPPLSDHQKTGSNPHQVVLDPPLVDSKKSPNKRPLPSSPEPKRKRRLVPTKGAAEIANKKFETFGGIGDYLQSQSPEPPHVPATYTKTEFGFVNPFPDGFPLTDEENWLLPDPHPGSCLYQDLDHEDEGYWSKVVSPETSGEGETVEEQEERLKRLLSKFHQKKQTAPESAKSIKKDSKRKLTEEENLLEQARECMLREQEAGAHRSRKLREKALRRRGLLTIPETSPSSSSEQSKTSSDADVDNNSNNDLFSDDKVQGQSIDDLLDVAQEYATSNSSPAQTVARGRLNRTCRPTKEPNTQNPASCAAAEKFRTQSRHLSSQNGHRIFNNKSPPLHFEDYHDLGSRSEELGLQEKEKRLCEAKNAVCSGLAVRGSVSNPTLSNQFTPDDEIDPRARSTDVFEAPNDYPGSPDPDREQHELHISAKAGNGGNRSLPTRPLSGLEMLAAKREAAAEQDRDSGNIESQLNQKSVDRPSSSIAPGPNRGLTLPKNFDQLSEEQKEVIVQHEIAKERKRDLDVLGSVFWTFAQLRCFADREITERTMQTETNELYDIGKFIALVIERRKPGKMRRARIQDIRDNIRRRIQKAGEGSEEPSDVAIMEEMRRTFSQKHIDFIDDETPKVQEEIDRWGALRSTRSTKRHNARPKDPREREQTEERTEEKVAKRRVRFADEETQVVGIKGPMGRANEIDNRQSQSERREKLIEKLRAQLKLFETADQAEVEELQNRVAEIEAELERANQHQDGDESEEDDGAEFVFGAGHNAISDIAHNQTARDSHMEEKQELEEINRLEDGRQKEAGTHHTLQNRDTKKPTPSQQRFDPELLKQMQLKRSQPMQSQGFDPELLRQMQLKRDQQLEAATDSTIIDRATVGESDSEGDVASEATSDEDKDDDRQVFRYTVWGAFVGVEIYKDADHYYFMKTYNVEKARDKVREIISGIHKYASSESGTELSRVNVQTELHYELMDQHIILGEDSTVEARVWIERDLVDLKKKAFRAAKRQRALKQVATFAVYWEKIITPLAHAEEAENHEPDRLDDLFEESLTDKAKTAAPVKTSIPQDEIEFFTTPLLANRCAKDRYLTWHFTFLPGWQNEGYRRLEDESMEQYLEALGSWGLFVREESFERAEVDERGAEKRVEEKFKVWVKKIAVKGPGN